MRASDDPDVQAFIEDTRTLPDERPEILLAVRELVFETCPDADEQLKYGGILFALEDDFAGLFVYQNHVSLEFSDGASFDDPDDRLEGTGNSRRHLKFESEDDVQPAVVTGFLEQAI